MLVVAGAGSGKTESMARRIEHLVTTGQAEPAEIMALTFTNKAAAELAKRVRSRLGADTDVLVSTYHGFAASLVNDHVLELDLPPRTTLINRGQAWQLCLSQYDTYQFEQRSSYVAEFGHQRRVGARRRASTTSSSTSTPSRPTAEPR